MLRLHRNHICPTTYKNRGKVHLESPPILKRHVTKVLYDVYIDHNGSYFQKAKEVFGVLYLSSDE